jgi:predicted nucleotidyltransferase
LFGQPERAFGKSELIQLAGGGSGAVQREVQRLVDGGLATEQTVDRKRLVQASPSSPLFSELCSIIAKTSGVAAQLRVVLAPLADEIVVAALFGSVAKSSDRGDSDIDILVVSDVLRLEDLYRELAPLEEKLGRAINPTLYNTTEFRVRRQNQNPFLTAVLNGKYELLVGDGHGLESA